MKLLVLVAWLTQKNKFQQNRKKNNNDDDDYDDDEIELSFRFNEN
jgi:hypothetical protein